MNKKSSDADEKRFVKSVTKAVNDNDWAKAKKESEAFLVKRDDCALAYFLCSLAAFNEDDLVSAYGLAEKTVECDDKVREYEEVLAIICALLGNLNDSLFHAKIAAALPTSKALDNLRLPEHLPNLAEAFAKVIEQPLLNRAVDAASQGKWAEAESWFSQHISLEPENRDAHLGLVNCLLIQGLFRAAIDSLRAARHIMPQDEEIASQLAMALTAIGEFSESQAVHRWSMSAAEDDSVIHARALSDLLCDPETKTGDAIAAHQQWGKRFGLKASAGDAQPKAVSKDVLTVGYIIGALGKKSGGPAFSKILARHNPERIRTVGFGAAPLDASSNVIFQKAFQTWHDVKGMDPFTLASIVSAESIDILVFVGGFAAPELLVAFGGRMAPVQASWLNNSCGFGLQNMDVLFSDRVMIPEESDVSLYGERLAFMEQGGLLVDFPSDEDLEIGDAPKSDCLTFAADAALFELNPRTIEVWAHILHQAPESKMMLKDHNFLRSEENAAHLIGLFGDYGLAHRVDIIPARNPQDFFRMADVCLLPLMTNRSDVAVAAAWAGVPLVCLVGDGAHQRQTASVLTHLGLKEDAVASTTEDYVKLALSWANDDARRQAFADGVRDRLAKSPLVDFAARAADLERIYEELWKTATAGNG